MYPTTTTRTLSSFTISLVFFLLLILLTLAPPSDAKKPRRNAHKRLRNNIFPFSRGRGPSSSSRHRGSRLLRGGGGGASESKNVFFYSLPIAPPPKPRIILGDELNFSQLGIASSSRHHPTKHLPTSSLTALEHQLIEESINSHDDHIVAFKHHHQLPTRQQRRGKKTSGGGRLPSPRSPSIPSMDIDYYDDDAAVVYDRPAPPRVPRREQQHQHQQRRPIKPGSDFSVMGSMYRAAGELRNAYKAAIVQSAQVAKFTAHATSKYLNGVRNIFGGSGENTHNYRPATRGPGYRLRNRGDGGTGITSDDDESFTTALSGTSLELPGSNKEEEVQYDDDGGTSAVKSSSVPSRQSSNPEDGSSSGGGGGGVAPTHLLPKLHLDVGGSFWPLFYKRSKMHGGGNMKKGKLGSSLSEAEGRVDRKE